jgi:hypothetical protein
MGFNADPDPALIAIRIQFWIQEAKPMMIHADPNPGQTFMSQKAFSKGRMQGLFVKSW